MWFVLFGASCCCCIYIYPMSHLIPDLSACLCTPPAPRSSTLWVFSWLRSSSPVCLGCLRFSALGHWGGWGGGTKKMRARMVAAKFSSRVLLQPVSGASRCRITFSTRQRGCSARARRSARQSQIPAPIPRIHAKTKKRRENKKAG